MGKFTKLQVLYNEDGSRKLAFGSYAKLATELQLTQTYIRQVLSPYYREWNVEVFRAALKLLKKQHEEEKKLQNEIAAIVAAIEKN